MPLYSRTLKYMPTYLPTLFGLCAYLHNFASTAVSCFQTLQALSNGGPRPTQPKSLRPMSEP